MQTLEITKLFQFNDGRFLCLVLPEEPEDEDDSFLPGSIDDDPDMGAIYIGHEGSNIQVLDILPMSIMGGVSHNTSLQKELFISQHHT